MSYIATGKAGAIVRLSTLFGRYKLLHIERRTSAAGHTYIRFHCEDDKAATSGRLITSGEHWDQMMIMRKGFAGIRPQPELRSRMRDLRRCGIRPERAAELVLEHYYREG